MRSSRVCKSLANIAKNFFWLHFSIMWKLKVTKGAITNCMEWCKGFIMWKLPCTLIENSNFFWLNTNFYVKNWWKLNKVNFCFQFTIGKFTKSELYQQSHAAFTIHTGLRSQFSNHSSIFQDFLKLSKSKNQSDFEQHFL